ncbi:MAG: hypothetical protein V8T29_08710 [Oscillospiraceae bacterium]
MQYPFTDVAESREELRSRSEEALWRQLKGGCSKKVEEAIGNDRRNLTITKITDFDLLSKLDYALKYSAKEQARKRFLDTVDFEPPVFQCHYDPDRWTEDMLLSCISDPEGYADKEAADYIAANQDDMLFDFLYHDAVVREYEAILADTGSPVHIVKKIMEAMRTTSAKTVMVTVCKEGTEFTFKMEAAELRRCTCNYHAWNIVAADRRKLEAMFGSHTDFIRRKSSALPTPEMSCMRPGLTRQRKLKNYLQGALLREGCFSCHFRGKEALAIAKIKDLPAHPVHGRRFPLQRGAGRAGGGLYRLPETYQG